MTINEGRTRRRAHAGMKLLAQVGALLSVLAWCGCAPTPTGVPGGAASVRSVTQASLAGRGTSVAGESPRPLPATTQRVYASPASSFGASPTSLVRGGGAVATDSPSSLEPSSGSQSLPASTTSVSPSATCTSAVTQVPLTASSRVARPVPSPTPSATRTPSPTVATGSSSLPVEVVSPCPPPTAELHLWFTYPISPDAGGVPTTYYPYGSTAGGEYLVHHGVDFPCPQGTSVWAAGSGTVLYAGNDAERLFSYRPDFYGQLVLLRMDRSYRDQPVFTLYGHLSAIDVAEGQHVDGGQKVGEVGATGVALGPHLHFEVRIADPQDYSATRNPELWLKPNVGRGIIAGLLLDESGNVLSEAKLALYPAQDLQHAQRYGWNYAVEVTRDDEWSETFVLGDVAAGEWAVVALLRDRRVRQRVTVHPGEVAWVCLGSVHQDNGTAGEERDTATTTAP